MSELPTDYENFVAHANIKSCDPAADSAPVAGLHDVPTTKTSFDDAELLRLCDLFDKQNTAFISACEIASPEADEISGTIFGWRDDTAKKIQVLRPVTMGGTRAKSAAALALLTTSGRDQDGDGDIQFVLATLRDMVGEPVA